MLDILEQKLTSVSKKPISELKKAGINYFNSAVSSHIRDRFILWVLLMDVTKNSHKSEMLLC